MKIVDFLLYSSLWIATCAAALVTFTYDITGSGMGLDAYTGLVFCGTIVIYSVHRLTGIERVKAYPDYGRFAVIREYRTHIVIYGILGFAGACFFLFRLPSSILWWLAAPCVISAMYVAPFGKRWRDYALVKIFLVAASWAALTGVIPLVHAGLTNWLSGTMVFIERVLFIFAIAIPFDIRDQKIDAMSGLKTLPHVLGVRKAKWLALGVLALSLLFTVMLIHLAVYDNELVVPYMVCWILTALLVWYSKEGLDDYYFSGLLDGMLFLLAFGYWAWGYQ